jgi:mRNA interferase HigB
MIILGKEIFDDFYKIHHDSRKALGPWLNVVGSEKTKWKHLIEVQSVYNNSVEAVGNWTVFNIKGNTYRLIVDIVYASQIIFIKYILTHAEYDKDKWKNNSGYKPH